MFHFSGLISRISQNNSANKYSWYNLQTCTSSRIYDLFTDMNIITNLWNAIQFFAYILFCISLTAGKNGKAIWSVQLSPRPAGGPYNLKVSVQGTSITLVDVLFGDVWLCSGQSNMVFVVSHVSKIDWINYWTLKGASLAPPLEPPMGTLIFVLNTIWTEFTNNIHWVQE